jgi:cell division protein FtsI (penicillin-binding protein 3)
MVETESTGRIRVLVRLALVWAALIVAKLVYLQICEHKEFVRIAQQQQQRQLEIQGPRGTIFDRTGQPLAKSLPVDSICVNPLRVPDYSVAAEILAKTLDLSAPELFQSIKTAAEKNRGFLWIKRRVTPEESTRLRSMNLDWIEFRTESRRFYPNGQLASHVVGSVDHLESGNSGLELFLDDDLTGKAGEVRMLTDVKQHAYASEVETQPLPGKDVVTTIDSRIQYVAERELTAAAVKSHAKSGSLVAMNPKTGEILAMANYPSFNPNDPVKPGESQAARNNVAITSPYEPGSVFKVVTLSAALETTHMGPETVVNCGHGILRLGSRVIHEAHGGYGGLTMAEVLAKSSNIGAIQFGLRVGPQNMYDYRLRLGFGKPTGVSLPSESGGRVRKLSRWGTTSLASMSMGHEVMVTAMQLAQLGAIVANGGLMIKPKLVIKKQRTGEPAEVEPEQRPVRVLRPQTAITMRQMMEGVVLHGTGKGRANLKGYTSGGKTGTAQIYDFATRTYTHHYNGSFLGFAPVANPAVVIIVTLNGTSGGSGYGGQVAAPVFREVATAALRILDVPKDLPEDVPPVEDEQTDTDDLSIAGLDPEAGPELESSVPTMLVQGPPALDQHFFATVAGTTVSSGPRVPDFSGKTMRDALEVASSTGLQIEVLGRGIARAQQPPPGAILPRGEKVRVQFTR